MVVNPTDTCYGLAADIGNKRAVAKIYAFKGRDYAKPLSVMVKDLSELAKYGEYSPIIKKIMKENPARQFTFVVKRKKAVPDFFNPGLPTIGIQIPRHKLLLALLEEFGSPLTTTSTNLSGWPACYSIRDLLTQIKKGGVLPGLIIDAGELPPNPPSRIVRIDDEKMEVLRR